MNRYILILLLLTSYLLSFDETGMPFVKTEQAVKHLGVGLSSDGKTFYTYANNTLIHWNINPIKMIDAIEINDPLFRPSMNFDILSDQKKVIFSHWRRGLGLFDLETKQVIKKIPMRFSGDTLVGSNIITVERNRKITVRSLEDLDLIKTVEIPETKLDCDECHDKALTLLKSENGKVLALVTGIRLIAFDSVTLKQLKEEKIWFGGGGLYGSVDHRTVSGYNMTLSGYESFDLNTLQRKRTTREPKGYNDSSVIRSTGSLRRWYSYRTDYQYNHGPINVLFRMKSKKLYQFMDGNWLIITDSGEFDGSDGARQYLKIKTKSGQLVPIDATTYEKYHTQINLEG